MGNIGSEYVLSRHNAGFLSLTEWSEKHKLAFKHSKVFDFARFRDAYLIKPNTYMNRSGLALSEAIRKWKPEEVLVIHDDIELPLAKLRIRNGGGDGGHNGVKSLLEAVTPDSLKRIRIGIGRGNDDPRDYVLDEFTPEDLKSLKPALTKVAEFVDIYISYGFHAVLNEYSKWNKSCSGELDSGNTSPKEKNNG